MRIARARIALLVLSLVAACGGGCDREGVAPMAPETPSPAPVAANSVPTHKLLVLFVTLQGTPRPDLDLEAIEQGIFPQVVDFFAEVSYGRMSFAPEFFGWYEIPVPAGTCRFYDMLYAAVQAADNEVDFSRGYQHLIVISAGGNCTASGSTALPPEMSYTTAEGTVSLGSTVIDSRHVTPMVISHELGHQLHLANEGNFLSCGWQPLLYPVSQCFLERYADFYTVMGGGAFNYLPPHHFSAPEKEAIGFLTASEIRSLTVSGRYTISPMEIAGEHVKALKFPTANGAWIYIEYRQPIGWDTGMDNLALPGGNNTTDVYEGALMHVKVGTVPYLFDASAAYGPGDWSYCTLHVGETFVESSSGDSITVVARTPTALTVDAIIHDITAPTVQMLAPDYYTTWSGFVTFRFRITDDTRVASATLTATPYSTFVPRRIPFAPTGEPDIWQGVFDTSQVLGGWYDFEVSARDASGNTLRYFTGHQIVGGMQLLPPPYAPPIGRPGY